MAADSMKIGFPSGTHLRKAEVGSKKSFRNDTLILLTTQTLSYETSNMDPLNAIGLVGNIVQFVDFGCKLLSKTVEGYRSADGAFVDNATLEIVTNDFLALTERIRRNGTTEVANENPALTALCSSCNDVAKEFLNALAKLKQQGGKSKWKSFRKALRSVWSKEKILGIEKRLSSFRDEINLRIVVELRDQLDLATVKQSDAYKRVEDRTREIIDLIINQCDVFSSNTNAQTVEIKAMHAETNETITKQHTATRIEIIETIQITEQSSEAAQQATKQEIAQLKTAIQQLSDQIKQRDAELGELMKSFSETRNPKKKKALRERSNAVSATLLALEMMYRSLLAVLKSLQTEAKAALEPLRSVQAWRISAYPAPLLPSRTSLIDHEDSMVNRTPPPGHNYAIEAYYKYFYGHLHASRDLVDEIHLERVWKPLYQVGASEIAANANVQGFKLRRNTLLNKEIWIMAIVVAVLDAWASTKSTESDFVKRYTCRVLAKVFQQLEGSKLDTGSYVNGGPRETPSREDIGFWRIHAKVRGIDTFLVSAFGSCLGQFSPRSEQRSYSMGICEVETTELAKLLIWLFKSTKNSVLRVSEPAIHNVAKLLRAVGMKIITDVDVSNYEEQLLGYCTVIRPNAMRMVILMIWHLSGN